MGPENGPSGNTATGLHFDLFKTHFWGFTFCSPTKHNILHVHVSLTSHSLFFVESLLCTLGVHLLQMLNRLVLWILLVSCSADMTIKFWDFQVFECVKTLYGKSFFLQQANLSTAVTKNMSHDMYLIALILLQGTITMFLALVLCRVAIL